MFVIISVGAGSEEELCPMRKRVTRLSPKEWSELDREDKAIYRAFRDKYEWDPSLRVSLTGANSALAWMRNYCKKQSMRKKKDAQCHTPWAVWWG